jgi:molybdate-binding protein/DNA-binding XRE family transcriptional regulator
MTSERPLPNRVKFYRQQQGWSQDQLAERAGISRAAVSAIEVARLVPSVAAALALARAFDCRVEDLFGNEPSSADRTWAWQPQQDPCRFWRARVADRVLHFPAEPTVAGILPHDGIHEAGQWQISSDIEPERTLVMASCDPAAGLLAAEYHRATGFRLLPLQRSSREALDLLRRGLVDVAGMHLAASDDDAGNASQARAVLGPGFSLLRFATWDEGLAIHPSETATSIRGLLRGRLRWVGREPGTGARACQDEVLHERRQPRHLAKDHRGVVEAIRSGWADVGVCLKLVCTDAGLRFLQVRQEAYDLCFPTALATDPRLRGLISLIRSAGCREMFAALPGYQLATARDVGPI